MKIALFALMLVASSARAEDAVAPLFKNPLQLGEPLAVVDTLKPWAYDAKGNAFATVASKVRRYDPADPEGTAKDFKPHFVSVWLGQNMRISDRFMATDLSGLWFIFADMARLEVRFVADADFENAPTWSFEATSGEDWAVFFDRLNDVGGGKKRIAGPNGPCMVYAQDVWCIDLDLGTVGPVLDEAALEAAIPPVPHLEKALTEPLQQYYMSLHGGYRWELGEGLYMPDGRLFLIAWRWALSEDVSGNVKPNTVLGFVEYLLEIAKDGAISIRYGPLKRYGDYEIESMPAGVAVPTLNGARLMHWPQQNALVAWVGGTDYGWQDPSNGDATLGHYLNTPYGWKGQGLRIFPLDEPRARGTLSLTEAIIRRLHCKAGAHTNGCWQNPSAVLRHPDGFRILVNQTLDRNNTKHETEIHAFAPNFAALDLDEDGLNGAEEAALGTSDLLTDTDGGGDDDMFEARLYGSDPLAPGDDLDARLRAEGYAVYISSPLIRLRLLEDVGFVGTPSAHGPICAVRACYSEDGTPVVRLDGVGFLGNENRTVRAVDGSYLLVIDNEAFIRVSFEDGRRERALETADVLAQFPRDPAIVKIYGDIHHYQLHVVPVDEDRIWVVSDEYPARVVLFEQGQPRVVFDAVASQCAAGLGPCDAGHLPQAPNLDGVLGSIAQTITELTYDDLPVQDIGMHRIVYSGYDPLTHRVRIGVWGTWQTWLLGLHATEPPEALALARELLRPGSGDIFEDNGYGSPRFLTMWLDTGHGERLTEEGLFSPAGRPIGGYMEFFDPKTPIQAGWGDTLYFNGPDGPYELVRTTGRLHPGDLIVVSSGAIHHGEARGGLKQVWPSPSELSEPLPLQSIVGMDVSADGRLCATDGHAVASWIPSAEGGPPNTPQWLAPLEGAKDCGWDGERLLALTASTLFVYDVQSKSFTEEREAPANGFLRLADGALAVRVGDARVESLSGAPVDPVALAAAAGWREPALAWKLERLRPDGLLFADDELSVTDTYHPDKPSAPYAYWQQVDEGTRFAVVPGGDPLLATDPWTGATRGPPAPGGMPETIALPAPAATATDGGGCAVGTTSRQPVALFVLFVLVAWLGGRATRAAGARARRP